MNTGDVITTSPVFIQPPTFSSSLQVLEHIIQRIVSLSPSELIFITYENGAPCSRLH